MKAKLAADVTLEEEVSRNWSEICSREYLFDRRFKDVDNLVSSYFTLFCTVSMMWSHILRILMAAIVLYSFEINLNQCMNFYV